MILKREKKENRVKNNLLDNISTYNGNKYVCFDIETTGLSYKTDDILEISILPFNIKKDKYHSYIHTDKKITPDVTAINKISNAMLKTAPDVKSVLNRIYVKYSDCVFVAHNAHNFDAKFMLQCGGILFDDFMFLDTLELARDVLPGLKDTGFDYSMSGLCRLFGIKIKDQHTADGDTKALKDLFVKLMSLLDDSSTVDRFIKPGRVIRKKM